jgi:hypothetical protein
MLAKIIIIAVLNCPSNTWARALKETYYKRLMSIQTQDKYVDLPLTFRSIHFSITHLIFPITRNPEKLTRNAKIPDNPIQNNASGVH